MVPGTLVGWIDTGLTGLFVLTGAIMTFFILLQEGKGGGLTSLGGTKAAGVEGVTNPIRRATVYMAILFFTLAIILGILNRPRESIKIGSGTGTPAAAKSEAVLSPPAKTITTEGVNIVTPPAKTPVEATKPAEIKTIEAKAGETKTEAVKTPEPPKTEAKKDEPKKADEPKN